MRVVSIQFSPVSCLFRLKLLVIGQFNEESYYKKIAEVLSKESSGVSSVKLAEKMNVNVVLMKEHI